MNIKERLRQTMNSMNINEGSIKFMKTMNIDEDEHQAPHFAPLCLLRRSFAGYGPDRIFTFMAPKLARRPAHAEAWNAQQNAFRRWVTAHDGACPSRSSSNTEERKLSKWISNQRVAQRKGQLSSAREELLTSLPSFIFEFDSLQGAYIHS